VVALVPPTRRASAVRPLAEQEISQENKQFVPAVRVVTVGTLVRFPNRDSVRHHVYSFSPTKKFEIKLYAGTPAAPVLFDQPGVAVLGCNIHDQMVGWVVVLDTPYFAQTNAQGQALLEGRCLRAGTSCAPGTRACRRMSPPPQQCQCTLTEWRRHGHRAPGRSGAMTPATHPRAPQPDPQAGGVSILLLLIVQAGRVCRGACRHRPQRPPARLARELDNDERVWLRLLEQNAERLRQGSALLAADYGFRSAVSSDDEETIQSVLENHGAAHRRRGHGACWTPAWPARGQPGASGAAADARRAAPGGAGPGRAAPGQPAWP
jgi:plastocyanin